MIEHIERIAFILANAVGSYYGWKVYGAKLEQRLDAKLDKAIHEQRVEVEDKRHAALVGDVVNLQIGIAKDPAS